MAEARTDSSTCNAIHIIAARPTDLPDMAQCHIIAFPKRFMAEMGPRWLCALYRFFLKHPNGISCVAIDATGKVVGFAVGGEPNMRDLFLHRAVFRYPHIIIWKFLTNPLVRRVLLKELTRKSHSKCRPTTIPENTKTQGTTTRRGNLLSICVLPDYKGTGIDGKLIRFFQLACTAEGYNHLMLSVTTDNLRAIAFYKKHGWRETGKSGKSIKFALNLQPSLMEP